MADNPKVNQPSSGTYGEKTEITNLKKSLPATQGSMPSGQEGPLPPLSPEPVAPPPAGRVGRPPTGAALPPGVPPVLAAPTERPDVPVSTPLQGPRPAPMSGVSTPSQGRLAVLEMLSSNPDVSDATREWAREVMDILLGGSGE